ncbi:MAG: hypothetical protein WC494_02400 [Candidatus Pacearchaeota archaeon]
MDKKAQQTMSMPFGIIFAIFLIVVFVVVAFFAIKGFLDIGESSEVGLFYQDLQEAIDRARSSQTSEFEFEINLPKEVEFICFANLSAKITANTEKYELIEMYKVYEANVFLLPPESADSPWKNLDNINITKITEKQNPYCVPSSKNLVIKKSFYDRLVSIE